TSRASSDNNRPSGNAIAIIAAYHFTYICFGSVSGNAVVQFTCRGNMPRRAATGLSIFLAQGRDRSAKPTVARTTGLSRKIPVSAISAA
ncbi:MAG TPA: hypothetical protein VMV10_09445, partial [Pirellulales bacterium]|nr:hypothetical protein [Pirellulales bacterium]